MKNALFVIQIILSVLLIIVVVLQNRGGGAGALFGGADAVYATRRGAEKLLARLTVILTILFLGVGLAGLFI